MNEEIAPDRGWCLMWENWQKLKAPTCKYCESKFEKSGSRENFQKPEFRKNSNQRFVKKQGSERGGNPQDDIA